MLMSICLCRHGLTTPHAHPITVDGSSKWCTDMLEMFGNTTSIARILISLRLCRVCTSEMIIMGSTPKEAGQIHIRPRLHRSSLSYMARFGDPTRILALCLIDPGKETSVDHTCL